MPWGWTLRRSLVDVVVVGAVALTARSAVAGSVQVHFSGLHTLAASGGVIDERAADNVVSALPWSDAQLAQTGLAAGSSAFDFSPQQLQVDFTAGLSQGAGPGEAVMGFGALVFTPDADTTYDVSGLFSLSDQQVAGLRLATALSELGSTPTSLFSTTMESLATPGASLVVGSPSGDLRSDMTGSTTGTLLAGHVYQFEWTFTLYSTSSLAFGTLGQGGVTLRFDSASSLPMIPLPTSAGLAALGLSALSLRRRRMRAF